MSSESKITVSRDALNTMVRLINVRAASSTNAEHLKLCIDKDMQISTSNVCTGNFDECKSNLYCKSNKEIGIGYFHINPSQGYKVSLNGDATTTHHTADQVNSVLTGHMSKALDFDTMMTPSLHLVDCVGNKATRQLDCLWVKEPVSFGDSLSVYPAVFQTYLKSALKSNLKARDDIFSASLELMRGFVPNQQSKDFLSSILDSDKGWLGLTKRKKQDLYNLYALFYRSKLHQQIFKESERMANLLERKVESDEILKSIFDRITAFEPTLNNIVSFRTLFVPEEYLMTDMVDCTANDCTLVSDNRKVPLGANSVYLIEINDTLKRQKIAKGLSRTFPTPQKCIYNRRRNVLMCGPPLKSSDLEITIPDEYMKHLKDFLDLDRLEETQSGDVSPRLLL